MAKPLYVKNKSYVFECGCSLEITIDTDKASLLRCKTHNTKVSYLKIFCYACGREIHYQTSSSDKQHMYCAYCDLYSKGMREAVIAKQKRTIKLFERQEPTPVVIKPNKNNPICYEFDCGCLIPFEMLSEPFKNLGYDTKKNRVYTVYRCGLHPYKHNKVKKIHFYCSKCKKIYQTIFPNVHIKKNTMCDDCKYATAPDAQRRSQYKYKLTKQKSLDCLTAYIPTPESLAVKPDCKHYFDCLNKAAKQSLKIKHVPCFNCTKYEKLCLGIDDYIIADGDKFLTNTIYV